MRVILLIIIYISFISLGLPDSILGSAWPMIHVELSVPISYAGLATMIVAGGTIVSSLLSERLIKRFGTGRVTAISVLMTALGLIGTYMVPSFLKTMPIFLFIFIILMLICSEIVNRVVKMK